MQKRIRQALTLWSYVLLSFTVYLFDQEYKIRFQVDSLNHLFVFVQWTLLPITLWILVFNFKKTFHKYAAGVLAVAVTVPCMLVAVFAIAPVAKSLVGGEANFVKLQSISTDDANIVLYQPNCQLWCDYELVIRKEKPLFFGLKKFKTIWIGEEAEGVQLEQQGEVINILAQDGSKAHILPPYDVVNMNTERSRVRL